ncbi:hypothetical protein ACA910_014746 [Epithemia clementina (nom. ined.)]
MEPRKAQTNLYYGSQWKLVAHLMAVVAILIVGTLLMTDDRGSVFSAVFTNQLHDQLNDSTTTAAGTNQLHHGRQLQGLSSSFAASQLMQNFNVARAKFMDQLRQDYGPENIQPLFQTTYPNGTVESVTRTLFQGSPLSWDRMKRKVAMKILQAQIDEQPQTFIWATGGHSASAGHGNLFNESYTAIMELKSKPILEAVGVNFVARRYAMGGTSCGMEINSCIKEVFGVDIDFLSWDYGMTTGRASGKTELYFHRAALLPKRPALLSILGGGSQVWSLEEWGPAVFAMSADSVIEKIPDTAGKSQEEIDQMPEYIRSFRCGKGVEKGNPTCDKEKYTILPDNDPCNKRKGQVSWHPGWKWHALYGNLLTLFWIELVDDALKYVAERGSDPRALVRTLDIQEEQEFQPMRSRNVSNLKFVEQDLGDIEDIPTEVIYWNPNYCHTARVPSQIRYLGILTESEEKGGPDSYDHGSELNEVRSTTNDIMPLAWDKGLYQEFCQNYRVVIDYQDFFVVNSLGWSKLVLPNPAEIATYGPVQQNPVLLGYISICLASCGWSCPASVLVQKDLDNVTTIHSRVSMQVNGVDVERYTRFVGLDGATCQFLKHSGGHKWAANENGLYEIRAKTLESPNYLRISAFVIW